MDDEDQTYRDRWLNCFLAAYATIGVLSGIAISVATAIRREENSALVGAVCILSAIQVALILWMFQRMRVIYDRLGFTPKFKDALAEEAFTRETQRQAQIGKRLRQYCERAIHLILLIQGVLLWLAWK